MKRVGAVRDRAWRLTRQRRTNGAVARTLSLTALAMLLSTAPLSDVSAQRRSRAPAARYTPPPVSPWISIATGPAVPVARCVDCDLWYGGLALMAAASGGVTLHQRYTIGAEWSGMSVLLADSRNAARTRLLVGGVDVQRGVRAKVGVGTGRYLVDPTYLVDERSAWMIGVEGCSSGRLEVCSLVDFTQTAVSSDGRYRLRVLRAGSSLRFHVLPR